LACGAGLILVWIAALPSASLSQSAPGPVVARVSLEVDGQDARPEYAALVSIKPGHPYSFKSVRDAVRQLYASGLFSDVRAERSGDQDIVLTFHLVKKLAVRSVNFLGPSGLSTSGLGAGLTVLKPGSEFSPEKQARAESEIKDFLKGEGYFRAEVRCLVTRDSQASAVDLTFDLAAGPRYIIDRIDFIGDSLISLRDIEKRLTARQGGVYIPTVLDKDRAAIGELYRSRGYQQAQVVLDEVQFHNAQGTVTITLRLDPGEKVEIVVRGAKVPSALLTPIWQERVFEEWGLLEGEARILSYLRKKGNLFAIVTSSAEHQDYVLRVVHEVDPGARYRIRGLVFEGMTHFTVSQLRTLLGLQEGLFSFGIVDGQRIFELPGEIENLYRTRGFADISVNLDFYREGSSVTAILALKEGPQQRIQDVSIVGASLISQDALLSRMSSRPGAAFFQPNIQRDVEALKAYYLGQGFRGTIVSASAQKAGDNLFSAVFSVDEGRRMKIAKIIIAGLRVTRKSTVLRELAVQEGQDAREGAIQDTKRNLERLGIFSEVRLEEVPADPGFLNLVIRLQEGERNYAGLGLGLETARSAQSFAVWNTDISPRVTAEYILGNIFGDASQFSLAGQFSFREKRAVMAYERRYLFGLAMQNSVSVLVERVDLPSFEFDRRGFSFNIVKPLFRDVVLMTTLQWAQTTIISLSFSPNEIDREFFPYSKTSITAILSRDRRDDPYNPVRGTFLSLAVEWAYPLFGVESDFQKIFFKYQNYLPVAGRVNFNATFRLGLGRGRVPIHERFFAGGSNSFRGEYFDELGPKDSQSGQPIGGKLLTLLNLELTVPFLLAIEDLSWIFFYDIGNVFSLRSDFNVNALENVLGFGLRYRTPLGPLRLEIGLNLNAPGAGRKVIPFITIGNLF
jgi:outer membrane protein insertion porin family